MSENDKAIVADVNEMKSTVDIIYPEYVESLPGAQYGSALAHALLSNDAGLLMEVLDSQDINPWDVDFVEDGLGQESQDKQSMIVYAIRKKSWACVAQLVEHYLDCGQLMQAMAAVVPAFAEYEVATDPERIDFVEFLLIAANSGYAKHLAKGDMFNVVFQPSYISNYPKATRFVFKNFAAIGISNKKLGLIVNKRLALRQKTFAAIAAGDSGQMAVLFDAMNANAAAYCAATKNPFESLTGPELKAFIAASISCEYPECVQAVLSKSMEFEKLQCLAKSAGKNADKSRIKALKRADDVDMMGKVLFVAKAIDQHSLSSNIKLAACIESSIEKAVYSVLSQSEDRELFDKVKSKSEEIFTVLKPCIDMACARAQSVIEKKGIADFIPANDQTVVPRERAGMRL